MPSLCCRVALHEAGHFLVAYLVGLLPSGYTLSAWDALVESRALNVQAGTRFCDLEFQREVALGKIRSGSVDTFTCVALAGVITEYLRFGSAEGGMGDVLQLDRLLRGIGFTQRKADDQVRWAVISTADMLRRHAGVQDALAEAMRSGMPVGDCIALIEERLAGCDDV